MVFVVTSLFLPFTVFASYHLTDFRATSPIHIYGKASKVPLGITPEQVKNIYHLPQTGGSGVIAIIGAYNDSSIEKDLNDFSTQFGLPSCTSKNGCFEKHLMSNSTKSDSGWDMETSLDVEWAHAIAPEAKILLIEATTPSGSSLLKAIDYAVGRPDVTVVSMSWGGAEFPEEVSLDSHFAKSKAIFFASSGDNGTGASWPASSPYVIGVGGTTLSLGPDGSFKKETAWSGSGGGVSVYEKQPRFQSDYSIAKSGGFRAIPDVSYNADPASGFPVIRGGLWHTVGGTSAGAPQWAAIATLGTGASNINFYTDKASSKATGYFRDIVSGSNGECGYICNARKHYDYVTGLGSPLSISF